MNRVIPFLCLVFMLCGTVCAQEKKRYVLYAELIADLEVHLADGTKWEAEKGDVFPVMMFKEQQTKAVLQLAGTSFLLRTDWIKTIEEKDLSPKHAAAYRKSVQSYIDRRSEEWKAKLREGK